MRGKESTYLGTIFFERIEPKGFSTRDEPGEATLTFF